MYGPPTRNGVLHELWALHREIRSAGLPASAFKNKNDEDPDPELMGLPEVMEAVAEMRGLLTHLEYILSLLRDDPTFQPEF